MLYFIHPVTNKKTYVYSKEGLQFYEKYCLDSVQKGGSGMNLIYMAKNHPMEVGYHLQPIWHLNITQNCIK